MRFIDDSNLEKYYDKEIDSISPDDTPINYYINGRSTINCFECGETIETKCQSDFIEIAYCNKCELEFKRGRDPVIENIDYQYQTNRSDKKDDYVCKTCDNRHPITEPSGEWSYNKNAKIFSYESISLECPCGNNITINNLEFSSNINCSECSRVYEFSLLDE